MLQRVITGLAATGLLLLLAMTDALIAERCKSEGALTDLLRHGSLLPLGCTVVVLGAVVELVHMLRAMGLAPQHRWAATCCAALMLSPWLCAGGILGYAPTDLEAIHWQVVWLLTAFIGSAALEVFRGLRPGSLANVVATCFVTVYLGLLPSFAVHTRCDVNLGLPSEGVWNLMVLLAIVFASDIGALYVGSALGKHRLAPTISPSKSIEGFFGGIAGSVLIAAVARLLATWDRDAPDAATIEKTAGRIVELFPTSLENLSWMQVIILAVVMSIISQIGDLFESLCKRSAQLKDSSNLVPGMGGVLDVIDGALFAIPVGWILVTRIW